MPDLIIAAAAAPTLAVRGDNRRFPIHRIYCVGRNFAEHAREMGSEIDRGSPVFFMKPADAVLPGGGEQPFPSATSDLHHEVELVVALGTSANGEVATDQAMALVLGYALGLDLTRRDLQAKAKAKGLPWDTAKGFDRSAPISELVPAAQFGALASQRLTLSVNGNLRQQAPLSDMVWSVPEIIAELSRLYELRAGDLIFMGTPAGVAALQAGDRYHASIDDLLHLEGHFTSR
ncbi:MAG: fumarylacetoacetate hydrolase [Gammaproteobacteria bacterium HGW-Gammaproteobacteria-4]|jgi:2-keto-4-pentenoate hydratase/2-oxohepta-3-ene-1,7-dioic acid hydratase in catechol pathway|nr:MAG: fumarylacetoacetate hydrolase [Gammaproteobacteria bacterium HGW-Gammaproteobacteria-4]